MRSLSGPWMNDFDERYLKYHILSRKGIVEIDRYHGISGVGKPHVSWAAIGIYPAVPGSDTRILESEQSSLGLLSL